MSHLRKAFAAVAVVALLCIGSAEYRAAARTEAKPGPMRCRMYFGGTPAIAATNDAISSEVH